MGGAVHGYGYLVVHVGKPLLDEDHCQAVQFVEIVRAVGDLEGLPSQPPHDLLDVVDVLLLLCLRIRVVEPQVAVPPALPGQAEAHVHGLGMADVEVTVWLGGEPGDNRPRTRLQVLLQCLPTVFGSPHLPAAEKYLRVDLTETRRKGVRIASESRHNCVRIA